LLSGIWTVMILLAFVGAILHGTPEALAGAVGDGAQQAVETAFLLTGGLCLWSGLMRIAAASGLTKSLSRAMRPVIRRLFPEYTDREDIGEKITVNVAANLFGMGNAATPAGLQAMDAMRAIDPPDRPSRGMIRFVVMNTAALQFIPSSVVMLRSAYGAENPYDIMPHIWVVSLGSLVVGLLVCRILEGVWHR